MTRVDRSGHWLIVLLVVFTSTVTEISVGRADAIFWQQVQRDTSDRDADLIRALIDVARYEDALGLCRTQSRGSNPKSDRAAKWAIRQSEVLTIRQMAQDQFGEAELEMVRAPVQNLLNAYPDHQRQLFLKAQLLVSQQQAAYHAVLRAAVSPADDAFREQAARRLLSAMREVLALVGQVQEARALLDVDRNAKSLPLISDLLRLEQALRVDAVSLALVQTELFDRGSNDRIASATQAEQAADDAIAQLPVGTQARLEVERLKVEAIFRAEQLDRADAAFRELARRYGEPLPPKLRSLQIHLHLAQDRLADAEEVLSQYFGDSAATAPRSQEMDLARLEFLLLGNQNEGVGKWLDAIQERGGAYARRRAEAVSLARLRSRNDGDRGPSMDPSLIAAQGQDWLRRGEPGRAGELLSAAAAAERDPDQAISRAAEAAAAFLSAGRPLDAASILADISLAKPTGTNAAATHLQAAFLISQSPSLTPDLVSQLELMLRTNLNRWPQGKSAAATRDWLQNILTSQRRYLEAAKVASQFELAEANERLAQLMADAWILALEHTSEDASDEQYDLIREFQSSFEPLLRSEPILDQYRFLSALFLDRAVLADLVEPGPDETVMDRFVNSLIDHRRNGTTLKEPPPKEVERWLEQRLMADGRSFPGMRKAIVSTLTQWANDSEVSLLRAERLLWDRKVDGAIAVLKELRSNAENSAAATREAATLLGLSDDPKARAEAIRLWDELSSGLKQGSGDWHEAKLAAIRLLQQSGETAEAYRRAKFILLTQPLTSQELQNQYRAIPKP